jgi:hypothetical protein
LRRRKSILAILGAIIGWGIFAYKLSTWFPVIEDWLVGSPTPSRDMPGPTNTPDPDTPFMSCRDDALENGVGEVLDEWLDSIESEELRETCLRVPDWAARVEQVQAAYDECPEPVGPQLVQLRVLEGEYLDEFVRLMDMVILCCDAKPNCDPDTVRDHLNRTGELQKSISQQVDAYNAAHADN